VLFLDDSLQGFRIVNIYRFDDRCGWLSYYVVIQKPLNFGFEVLEIDHFLVANLHRALQLAELFPLPLKRLEFLVAEDIIDLIRGQRDVQAATESAQPSVEFASLDSSQGAALTAPCPSYS